MSIGRLRARADELAREASLERSRCRAGLQNAVAILRRGAGSPAGLAISFSSGFIAGTRRRGGPVERRDTRGTRAREQVVGTLVSSVAKLLVAMIANSLAVAKVRGSRAVPEQQDQPSRASAADAA